MNMYRTFPPLPSFTAILTPVRKVHGGRVLKMERENHGETIDELMFDNNKSLEFTINYTVQ